MNLGEKIIGLRKKEGMTQEELAGKLSVSRQTISKWELCQSNPELSYIVKLSELFGVTTDYLIKDEELQEDTGSRNEEVQNIYISTPNTSNQRLSVRQIAGIIVAALGGLFTIISLIMLRDSEDFILGIFAGVVIAVVGFELLIIKKNAVLKTLWTIWCIIAVFMSFFLVNTVGNPFNLVTVGGIMSCVLLVSLIFLIIVTIFTKIKKNTYDD